MLTTTIHRSAARVVAATVLGLVTALAAPATTGWAGGGIALTNGGFEATATGASTPAAWQADAFDPSATLARDTTVAHHGRASARITAPQPNDARWIQTVTVERDTRYTLAGWVRTKDVAHSQESVDAGASLGVLGRWEHTTPVFGSTGWTHVSMALDSGDDTRLTVAARLGFWSGTTTGTAWFDDLVLKRVGRTPPAASWRMLTLVYPRTDVRVPGDLGTTRHLVGTMTATQVRAASAAARAFAATDVPALSSGEMVPTMTVKVASHALTRLDAIGDGYWPSPDVTAADLSTAYDAVIVIWEPDVVDQQTGATQFIGTAAGLTPPRGTGQTYTTLIVAAATEYGHRNVFKHEFGHSLLFYFDAAGTAPRPTVDNHTDATTYVHCGTGAAYVWEDETSASPIPNSIYNNASGFTHDYYSGTTALASDPSHCLGITREAWASGRPTSTP